MNERRRHVERAGPLAENEPDLMSVLATVADAATDTEAFGTLMTYCPIQAKGLAVLVGPAVADILAYVALLRANNTRLPYGNVDMARWVPGSLQARLASALGNDDARTVTDLLVNAAVGWQPRLQLTFGAHLVAADFTLTGWGTGAAVAWIEPHHPNLNRFQLKVTAGTLPSAAPTFSVEMGVDELLGLQWRDLPLPIADVTSDDADVTVGGVYAAWDYDTLTLTVTYRGTPVATKGYVFNVLNIG